MNPTRITTDPAAGTMTYHYGTSGPSVTYRNPVRAAKKAARLLLEIRTGRRLTNKAAKKLIKRITRQLTPSEAAQ